ncbi:MAG: response regulator transcription factor [Chloroflexota bacterium]|nr:response regulator transcription factor [Chloroflexota bacterium]
MSSVHTILLVEGRKSAAEYLSPDLNDEGCNIVTARTRRDSLAIAQEEHPAVIVLDAPSLRFSCRRFCETLQETKLDIPVLMLLPPGEKIDRSIGARAHLCYPFSAKKLNSRIARLLPALDENMLKVGKITLNLEQQYVVRDNHESHLTPKQTQLLEVLMRHPGEVLSRAFLMKQVWETDYLDDTRTLDVHIHWVRKAIEDDHKSSVYLQTVRKVGYCLTAPKKE